MEFILYLTFLERKKSVGLNKRKVSAGWQKENKALDQTEGKCRMQTEGECPMAEVEQM